MAIHCPRRRWRTSPNSAIAAIKWFDAGPFTELRRNVRIEAKGSGLQVVIMDVAGKLDQLIEFRYPRAKLAGGLDPPVAQDAG